MLPTFHFVRVCMEKMIDRQYRENDARNIYLNYDLMRACVECSPNQSKNYTFSTFPSSNRRNFKDSGKVLAVSVSEFLYCSSALPTHAHETVITTVCVQIYNCFCNTFIISAIAHFTL